MPELDDTFIAFGTEIKTISDDGETMRIGAHLVLFGSPEDHDLYPRRDYFTKDTDFGLVEGKGEAPLLYHHGLNKVLGNRCLSTAQLSMTDDGVWMETELKARDAYERRVMQMVRSGKLGTSSGAFKKDIEREARVNARGDVCHEIKKWHLGHDASLTPTPADPRTLAMEMKSLGEVEEWADELVEPDEEFKYSPRQPRDDAGRWSEGGASGGLTAGHAIAVMKAEGIHDATRHEEVARAINVGIHATPEQVLRHIDRIHAAAKTGSVIQGRKIQQKSVERAANDLKVASKELKEHVQKGHDGTLEGRVAHLTKQIDLQNTETAAIEDLHDARVRKSESREDSAFVAPPSPTLAEMRDKARAAVSAAHGIRTKIMDARNAAMNPLGRDRKSAPDEIEALLDDWEEKAAEMILALESHFGAADDSDSESQPDGMSAVKTETEAKARFDSLLLDAELSLAAYSLDEIAMAVID